MHRSLPNWGWIVVALVLFASQFALAQQRSSTAAPIEQRVALVIGNSNYKESPLKNPVNDATDITTALRELGFRVVLRTNANRRQMVEAVREFGGLLKKGGVGLFYFAGHGVQSRGRNYLVPLGAAAEAEADLEFEAMDANMVLAQMDEAGNRVNIVVLDACRNNPFARSFRSASRGLAQMDAATGSFLAYATAPGSVAADGDGRNGIFTKHLLASLKNPDSKLEEVFKRVRVEVARETGNKQIPWDSSSLTGDFYFRAAPSGVKAAMGEHAVMVSDPSVNDRALWESVKESKSSEEIQAYLDQFPQGIFSGVARARIKLLQAPSQQIATVAPTTTPARPESVAYANLEVSTPAIAALQGSFQRRHGGLAPFYGNGAVGLTNNGLIAWRDINVVSSAQYQQVNALIIAENEDRNALYREIARANGRPEWESQIRATFSLRWIDMAPRGLYYQNSFGAWIRK